MSADSAPNPLAGAHSAGGIVIAAGAISIVVGLLAIAYPDITLLALDPSHFTSRSIAPRYACAEAGIRR